MDRDTAHPDTTAQAPVAPPRMHAPAHRRLDLPLQLMLVVLGALLALGFDQWRDARKDRIRAQMALESIRSELRANRDEVARAFDYHQSLANRFDRLKARQASSPAWEDIPRGLLAPAPVVATAWQSALATGAAGHIRYNHVLALSRVYERQTSYVKLSDAMLASAYQDIARSGSERLLARYANFAPLQRDFSGKESELLGLYDAALKTLDQ